MHQLSIVIGVHEQVPLKGRMDFAGQVCSLHLIEIPRIHGDHRQLGSIICIVRQLREAALAFTRNG